jgi:hypothetical protein
LCLIAKNCIFEFSFLVFRLDVVVKYIVEMVKYHVRLDGLH